MPELPEVETTKNGIAPLIIGRQIADVVLRTKRLRYPISKQLQCLIQHKYIARVERRAKYLLVYISATKRGVDKIVEDSGLLIHLGMSGSLRIVGAEQALEPKKHDHIDIILAATQNTDEIRLRYHDPRKFGLVLWSDTLSQHALLEKLGPEPFEDSFDGNYLYQRARTKKIAVKTFIMDQKTVVGVGNIYAAEALFKAGIHPKRAANKISRARYQQLAEQIKAILTLAIENGGTTLQDFVNGSGLPGYFQQKLSVYGRAGESCHICKSQLKMLQITQRASVYCPCCQH